jgi:hypothetical protein
MVVIAVQPQQGEGAFLESMTQQSLRFGNLVVGEVGNDCQSSSAKSSSSGDKMLSGGIQRTPPVANWWSWKARSFLVME